MTKAKPAGDRKPVIRNIAEVPWDELPGHHGGALSKLLVHPETTGSRQVDHRISTYQPKAYVAPHTHTVQEQVYHVLEGEGLMEIAGQKQVVRRHDVIFIPPGVEHALYNTGLGALTFIVVTAPVSDDGPPAA
ncbi:MAG TPA: cupin domain-containing protein [Alphaproteobacteria bacterium]|nr:cupin domain-containing protein [Alphaproteobacteria bacterium]